VCFHCCSVLPCPRSVFVVHCLCSFLATAHVKLLLSGLFSQIKLSASVRLLLFTAEVEILFFVLCWFSTSVWVPISCRCISFLRAGAQDPSVEVQFSCKDHRSRCQFGSLAEFLRFWSHSCRLGFPLGFFAQRALEFMPHASRSAPPEIVSPTRFLPAGLRSACFLPVALILL
jgi:hypothetical protein